MRETWDGVAVHGRLRASAHLRASVCCAALLLTTLPARAAVTPGASGARASFPPAAAILPPEGEGMALQGGQAVYAGEELYDYIDGGAPQFFEYGFREIASQELLYHEHTYILDVYRMADPLAAFGIFSVRRPVARDKPGTALKGFPYSACTASQGLLAHGPYYVEISAYTSSDATQREMGAIARAALGGLDSTAIPADLTAGPPFDLLPADLVPGSARIARGPIGLRTALRGSDSKDFRRVLDSVLAADSMQTAPLWVVADYHLPAAEEDSAARALAEPQTTLLIHHGAQDARALAEAAWRACAPPANDAASVVDLAGEHGWLVSAPQGKDVPADRQGGTAPPAHPGDASATSRTAAREAGTWFVASVGEDLWMGVSRMEPEALAAWVNGHLESGGK
jgi:hypothetical protein